MPKKSLAPDFVLPWAASSLALSGHPQDVYVQDRQWAAEKAAAHNPDLGYTYWSYPPTYLVVALPTALIPYRWSLLIWLAATLTAYCLVIWAIVPDPDALWIALAFPGTALNALAGQNGFLTTALFGAGLLLLRKKPIRAGVMFGLLTFKPQLGLLVPLVLIATRRWRAIAAAAFTAIAFAAVSLMMFGVGTWAAFLHGLPESSRLLNNGQMGWGKIQSVYGGLRLLGLGSGPAYSVQVIVALVCATIAVIVWRAHRVPFDIKAAVLVTATLLVTPYVVDYDFVLLALPIAWMARDGAQTRISSMGETHPPDDLVVAALRAMAGAHGLDTAGAARHRDPARLYCAPRRIPVTRSVRILRRPRLRIEEAYAAFSSDVQCGHRVAAIGIAVAQY